MATTKDAEHHARLLAAAPALFAALEAALPALEAQVEAADAKWDAESPDCAYRPPLYAEVQAMKEPLEIARAALAKARGETA